MKNTLIGIIVLISAPLFASVQTSGNWSDTNTWSTGTVEGLSSSTPLGVFDFASSGLTVTADSNVWVNTVNVANVTSATVNIDTGKIFTFLGAPDTSVTTFATGASTSSMVFNGGTVNFGFASEHFFEYGTWTFNSAVKKNNLSLRDSKGGVVNFNGIVTSKGQLSVGNKWTVNINNDYTSTGQLNVWGNEAAVNVASDVDVKVIALLTVNGNLNGNINVTSKVGSSTSTDSYNIALGRRNQKTGTITVGADAIITCTNSTGYSLIRNVTADFSSKTGSFNTASYLYVGGKSDNGLKTTITLNNSDIFCSRGQASQGASILNVGTFIDAGIVAADVYFNMKAIQNFGGFEFQDGSYMNLTTNGNLITVGAFTSVTSGQKFVNVEIEDLVNFTLKINNLGDLNILYDDDDNMMTNSITFLDNEGLIGYSNAYLVDAGDGSYWVNRNLIPEPANFAMFFGAFAMLALLLKKRGSRK